MIQCSIRAKRLLPIPQKHDLIVIQDFLRTREVGEFLSGALAGAMSKAVIAPLETIRLAEHVLLYGFIYYFAEFLPLPLYLIVMFLYQGV